MNFSVKSDIYSCLAKILGHCRNYSKILLAKPSKVETIIKSRRKSKLYLSLIKSPSKYGAFAIGREETTEKKKNKLMSNLDVFQHKKHIWHIKLNLIFPGQFPPFHCKGSI